MWHALTVSRGFNWSVRAGHMCVPAQTAEPIVAIPAANSRKQQEPCFGRGSRSPCGKRHTINYIEAMQRWACGGDATFCQITLTSCYHRCKKTFFTFLFWSRFLRFLTFFYFLNVFYLKTLAKFRAASRLTRSNFQNNSKEIDL